MTRVDDRWIGVERRPTGAPPEVEAEVIHFTGRDVVFIEDDGTERVYDADELRKVLEVPEDITATDEQCCVVCQGYGWNAYTDPRTGEPIEQRQCEACRGTGTAVDRDCPHCRRGRWTDSNGIERRCFYCGGVGRIAA